MRRLGTVLILALLLFMAPGQALAHGFGQRYDLPVPLWLYLYGAAGTVILSFLLIGFFVVEAGESHNYPRYNLLRLRWFRATLGSAPFLFALRLLSVALFLLVILSGLFGIQNPSFNFAPAFVWIIWWVGLSFFTAFFGNLWEVVNPWKVLFEWAGAVARRLGFGRGPDPEYPEDTDEHEHETYPARWGVWPALILYFAFVWVEIVFAGSPDPLNIAVLALIYSVITWGGMILYGKETWLRHGEAFTVFFGVLARFAPTEVRVTNRQLCEECGGSCQAGSADCVNCYECFARADPPEREFNLRPWAVGLIHQERVTIDRLTFVIFMLASVTFDGLVVTPIWGQIETFALPAIQALGDVGYAVFQTLGLVALPALFLAIYFGFSFLIRTFGGSAARLDAVAAAFVYSLVPIALAYQVAHYYTLFLVQGQSIFALISDPFGWGWNLFGTAGYEVNVGVVGAGFVWYSQVALVVAGHVIAVYLAHLIALRSLGDRKRALRSQYAMLGLMVLYTISSLWILSQPVVQENKAAPQTGTVTPLYQGSYGGESLPD